jgi:EAL domain-containing protein (putative c-di-GMP-specific phosphodiesterase class I)
VKDGDKQESWIKAPYRNLNELETKLDALCRQLGEGAKKIKAGISQYGTKPAQLLNASELFSRVNHREMVHTIQHGEFQSFQQPIINLKKGDSIYGYESLLRTAGRVQIPPGVLFKTAEETGLMSMLDQKARESAIKARKKSIPEGIKSFINFLPSTIYNPDFCLQHTFQIVEKYGINPADLVFEVVETEKISDVDHLKKVLNTYKKRGMKVALDDVGAGFSTLEMLEALQPDYLKIDRSYIDHCDQNHENQQFLSKVMNIAEGLGIIVLAEGIERKEELEFCRSIGADLAQGYYIGRPAKEIEADMQVNFQ